MDALRRRSGSSTRIAGAVPAMVALSAALAFVGQAQAEDEHTLQAVLPLETGRITRQEHPFVFLTDPSTPSAGVISLGYALGLGSGISADRPIPVDMAAANGSHSVQASYGLTDHVAPFAVATFVPGTGGHQTTSYQAGVTWQPTRPDARLRFSVSGAGLHEGTGGANGLTALAAVSLDQGPLRLAANLRADRVFAPGRDRVDAFALVGGTFRVTRFLRLGAEGVGQDLEDAFEADEAEGGARYSAGPTAAIDVDGGRYQVALGSGFGLNARSPRAVVRVSVAFSF